jgi:hypothetical protein
MGRPGSHGRQERAGALRRFGAGAALLLALPLFQARPASGCPSCRLAVRRAVHDGHFGARAAMMAAPFGLAGLGAAAIGRWFDRRKGEPR